MYYTAPTNNTSWFDSINSAVTGAFEKAKNAVSSSLQSNTSAQQSYSPQPSTYTMGGKRRRKSRRMRGGNFTDNTPRTGVASTASPITGIKSAQPHNLVGGRTRRRCRKSSHSKSCRHRKH